MNAGHLSLEGLPMDIATALSRFFLAAVAAGEALPDGGDALKAAGAVCAQRRADLVAAIKSALTVTAPAPVLPHAQTVRVGFDADDIPEPGFALRLQPFDSMEEAQLAAREGVQA